ncbi:ribosome biogenesis protein Nop16 [Gymnopilus junonius]|uniref:Nucleolar protein 16 n=1 Tax=Gymnopilus junonius TaxID=109634 RepID=A0A9P5TQT9_GYMJU|nr:ribosome biogenesis protein Nop16 [Gymnopilus junonius]
MANPRQRRKARSSSHRPISHSRHAKKNLKKTPPICGPKILQEAWDKQKTVRQNYAKLGLVVTLDPSAHGGVENPLGVASSNRLSRPGISLRSSSTGPPTKVDMPAGFGRIIRDQAGIVVGYDLNEPQIKKGEEGFREIDPGGQMDEDLRRKWTADFSLNTAPHIGQVNDKLVKDLEQASASTTGSTTLAIPLSGIGSRHTSLGEMKYLQPLARKYGDNVHLMARDLKLNPEQRTVGQLRRALLKSGLVI